MIMLNKVLQLQRIIKCYWKLENSVHGLSIFLIHVELPVQSLPFEKLKSNQEKFTH